MSTKIRIRCAICNEYEELNVEQDAYFKWLITEDINKLNLIDTDKVLLKKKICNLCRIRRE